MLFAAGARGHSIRQLAQARRSHPLRRMMSAQRGHPLRRAMGIVETEAGKAKRVRRDDGDLRLFVLSFTTFFICFYTFLA